MAQLAGNWQERGTEKRDKQAQVLLGVILERVNELRGDRCSVGAALRELWSLALANPVNIFAAVLIRRDGSNSEGMATVLMTAKMWDQIEELRGGCARGAVLRSLTIAGLKIVEEQNSGQ